jgi:hypothetical protein
VRIYTSENLHPLKFAFFENIGSERRITRLPRQTAVFGVKNNGEDERVSDVVITHCKTMREVECH